MKVQMESDHKKEEKRLWRLEGEHFISQDSTEGTRLLKNVKCEIFLSYQYFWIQVSFPSVQVHDANMVAVEEKLNIAKRLPHRIT